MIPSPARIAALAFLLTGLTCTARTVESDDAGDGSDSTATPQTTAPVTPTDGGDPSTVTTDAPGGTTGEPLDSPLCVTFGGQPGVEIAMSSFVSKLRVDERINAYFLTTDVDTPELLACLASQLGKIIGCSGVTYTCGDMLAAHAGLGISGNDLDDFIGDLATILDDLPKLSADDKQAVLAVYTGLAIDIVEDPQNLATIYQRIGRKPGIAMIVGNIDVPQSLIVQIASDATINSFFATIDLQRFTTCLVRRLITATGGPVIYGKEIDAPAPADLGVGQANPCRDMLSAHANLQDGLQTGVEKADFDALLAHLATALDNFGVSQSDQVELLNVLVPLCSSIVTVDADACP